MRSSSRLSNRDSENGRCRVRTSDLLLVRPPERGCCKACMACLRDPRCCLYRYRGLEEAADGARRAVRGPARGAPSGGTRGVPASRSTPRETHSSSRSCVRRTRAAVREPEHEAPNGNVSGSASRLTRAWSWARPRARRSVGHLDNGRLYLEDCRSAPRRFLHPGGGMFRETTIEVAAAKVTAGIRTPNGVGLVVPSSRRRTPRSFAATAERTPAVSDQRRKG